MKDPPEGHKRLKKNKKKIKAKCFLSFPTVTLHSSSVPSLSSLFLSGTCKLPDSFEKNEQN